MRDDEETGPLTHVSAALGAKDPALSSRRTS